MNPLERRLLNRLQNGIPVERRPFDAIASELELSSAQILEQLRAWKEDGLISRFGPMFNVEKFGGCFVLAACAVPPGRFEEVAGLVNAFPEVAHNYEREHRLNMWFVVATESPELARDAIERIGRKIGLPVLALPKEKEFALDLRFPL